MNRSRSISTYVLEKFRLGELPRKRMQALEKQIAASSELQERLQALEESDREILARYPEAEMVARIHKKAACAPQTTTAPIAPSRRFRFALPALAVAAIVVFLLVPWKHPKERTVRSGDSDTGTRIKGTPIIAPFLQLFRQRSGSTELLADGSLARPGDLVQLAYSAGDALHGVILSLDGKGTVTLHFPENPDQDTALRRGPRIFLPTAFELDNAPSFERFFFITAKTKIPVSHILEKANGLAASVRDAIAKPLDLPLEFRQFSLLIRKGEHP